MRVNVTENPGHSEQGWCHDYESQNKFSLIRINQINQTHCVPYNTTLALLSTHSLCSTPISSVTLCTVLHCAALFSITIIKNTQWRKIFEAASSLKLHSSSFSCRAAANNDRWLYKSKSRQPLLHPRPSLNRRRYIIFINRCTYVLPVLTWSILNWCLSCGSRQEVKPINDGDITKCK